MSDDQPSKPGSSVATDDAAQTADNGASSRGGPATPAAPAPDHLGRVGLLGWRPLRHEWTLAALGSLVLAVIMTWPSAWHPATTIPADIWDPTLQAWEMAWAGHIMVTHPSELWNANAFFPDQYSFAFSDTLFGYLPASIIGSGPTAALVRYNIMFILLHALAFFGAYALVRQLGSSKLAGAVAGAGFAFTPWRWGQAGHMHVLSVGGIALCLAMLARGHGFSLVDDPQRRRRRIGWIVAGWLTATWQLSISFGIGLPFAYVLAGFTAIAAVRWWLRGRPPLGRALLIADGVGLLIFAAVGGLMAQPYLEVLRLHPEATRTIADIQVFSPTVTSFFVAPAQSLMWGAAHASARAAMPAPAETTLLVGFTLYALAFAGLFFSAWSLRARLVIAAGGGVAAILALGTHFHGGKYTYVPLFHHLPGWSAIRTPGRLVIWVTLVACLLAAGTITALSRRYAQYVANREPERPGLVLRALMLLPLVLVLAEGANWGALPHPVVPVQPAAMRTVGGPLLVLPTDTFTDSNVMLWSTTKFQPMANGNSGFTPTDQARTRDVARSFPDASSVAYLRGIGIRYVLVVKDRIPGSPFQRAADPGASIDGLNLTRDDLGDTILYTLA